MYYTSKEVYEYISRETNDQIVEWKTCRVSGTEFPIFQSDLDFYKKISPKFGDETYQIPTPTLCPEERQRRRLMFRNERKLYRRKCDATGESIISIYSPDKPYKVYKQDFRWSDKRDPMQYGFDFDFNKTFTEQFGKLMLKVPHFNVANSNNENCEYANYMNDSNNCYLCFGSGRLNNCLYCNWTYESNNIIDCSFCFRGTIGYGNINCENFHSSFFCKNSNDIQNCIHCNSCHNCSNCFGCVGLFGKKCCIYNKQYTKEEYNYKLNIIKYIKNNTNLKNKAINISNSEICFGNMIKNSKNIKYSFEIDKGENNKFCNETMELNNGLDVSNFGYGENIYGFMGGGYNNNILFGLFLVNTNNLIYCLSCENGCSFCFGCIGLRNKQYCIFNKQYTKEEYFEITKKIVGHMITTGERGEFFDPNLSPFGYNETVAQEYFPISETDAKQKGYKRQNKDYDPVIPEHVQTLKGDQIPADISQVNDDILKKILVCEVSGRPFRIIKQELDFYKKHNLPLPRKHPDIRHEERLKQRPPRELHLRNCDKCGKQMVSVYDKNFEGQVYCEECYKNEVYS